MNYGAYLTRVKESLQAQAFGEIPLPADLDLALAMERQEAWGRLIIGIAARPNLAEPGDRERLVSAAGAWVRSLAPGGHLVLLFPFTRKVTEEEAEAIRRLRVEGPDRQWSVIPWTADLEVELLDRHSGFPPVPVEVARALADVPRGTVESFVRWATGPRLGRPRLLGDLSHVPATRLILATTVAYYLWSLLMGETLGARTGIGLLLAGPGSEGLLRWGANSGMHVLYEGQQWRLLTHIFLHGSPLHLAFNMWALWRLGQHVELIYGSWRMFFIYVAAGMTGGIASTALRGDLIVSVGASGAVLGLLGALIYSGQSVRDRRVRWQSLLGPVALNLFYGFLLPVIDNHAHIGGLVGGYIAGFVAGVPGQRAGWRSAAMTAGVLVLVLVTLGLIRIPHLIRLP